MDSFENIEQTITWRPVLRTTLSGVDGKPQKEAPIRNDLSGLFPSA